MTPRQAAFYPWASQWTLHPIAPRSGQIPYRTQMPVSVHIGSCVAAFPALVKGRTDARFE